MDADALFQYATAKLQDRDWTDAEAAFTRFTLQYPTHPRVSEARYRVGETFFARKEFVTAAAEFNRIAAENPTGEWADDARYQVCLSYYRLAPRPALYQEYTESAIDHCNSLLVYYPNSEFAPRARELITELTNRLAQKQYDVGESYFRRQAWHSANIYYDLVVAEFEGTIWAPRALLRLLQSYTALKYEPEAQAAKEKLLRDYPNSPEAKQVGGSAVRP